MLGQGFPNCGMHIKEKLCNNRLNYHYDKHWHLRGYNIKRILVGVCGHLVNLEGGICCKKKFGNLCIK